MRVPLMGVNRCLTYVLLFLLVCLGRASGQQREASSSIVPHVDERVELLSVVFRLAGNPEYHMDSLQKYSADIDTFFAAYKNHPAVQMAREVKERNGVSFDAVMAMAVSLSEPPELKPLVVFNGDVPDKRWGVTDAEKFLILLRDFYRDSRFGVFYAAHREFYREAETRFDSTLKSVDLGWYQRFYGSAPRLAYHLILGMNNGGGNYGPRVVYPDGHVELFSIIGCWSHDDAGDPTYPADGGYLSTIIHEFNHSFVNPVVAERWNDFSGPEQVFDVVAKQMRRQAYGNAQTMVDESLVRAAVIVYFKEAGEEPGRNLKRIREEQRGGFLWMDELVKKLEQYEERRAAYPTFASYMPQVVQFYRELPAKLPAEIAAFDAGSVHVVRMEPFANHAQDVDAALKAITIIVDKPLDAEAGYSIVRGAGGKEQWPITGKPAFEDGGLHIVLPVDLKPNHRYSFVLTPAGFASQAGYPLVEYAVEFKTR